MSVELPEGVIFRVLAHAGKSAVRKSGGKWTMHCCINPSAHKNGDRNPSGYADGARNLLGCPLCGTFTAKQAAEHLGVDWKEILRECLPQRVNIAPPKPVGNSDYPPERELHELWDASLSLESSWVAGERNSTSISEFLAGRALDRSVLASEDLARAALPGVVEVSPAWWPKKWLRKWQLLTRAYDAQGNFVSVHARAVVDGATPKTLWPLGCKARGLVMANAAALRLLRREVALSDVVVVEGLTDFLAASQIVIEWKTGAGVIGITSGSSSAFSQIGWPPDVRLIVATDDDPAGETYAQRIREAVGGTVDVRRWAHGGAA